MLAAKNLLRLSFALILLGCAPKTEAPVSGSAVEPKGLRMIGMDTNNASSDFSFVQSYSAGQSVGVAAGTAHLIWNGDEAAGSGATSGAFTDTVSQLASVNAYYPSVGSQASITIAPIDTPGFQLPSDLSGLPMDNANVIIRFNNFLDWALTKIPAVTLISLQIGNEIDIPSQASTALYWSQYKTFITAIVAHLHAVRPTLKVGVTVTLYGLTGAGGNGAVAKAGIQSLLPVIDVLGVTYYPLDSSFNIKDVSVVASDFSQALTAAGSTPVYFQEVGYPTSSLEQSSETKQAAFIAEIFRNWDLYATRIPFMSFLRMNDLSLSAATSLAAVYGLGGNAKFVAYLQTLGLRTYSSPTSYKFGWSELQNQTRARGWW